MRRYIEIIEAALEEEGRIVKGVNTTCDVGTDEVKKQAAKFGNTVTKDGVPPLIYEEDHLPDDSEDSPVPKQKDLDLPKPLKALFSIKR